MSPLTVRNNISNLVHIVARRRMRTTIDKEITSSTDRQMANNLASRRIDVGRIESCSNICTTLGGYYQGNGSLPTLPENYANVIRSVNLHLFRYGQWYMRQRFFVMLDQVVDKAYRT